MEFEMQPYGVYIKTDEADRIIAINSDAFLPDADGWVRIDEGYGDRYHHAQSNYLPGPMTDDRGVLRYKIVPFVDWPEGMILREFHDGDKEYGIFERTQEEMDADYAPPVPVPTAEERMVEIEKALIELAALMGG